MLSKREIVFRYLEKYPDYSSSELAKLIYKENIAAFTMLDSVRSLIRYYRGTAGTSHRVSLASRKYIIEHRSHMSYKDLPEGLTCYEDWTPIRLTENKILILSDIHIPYHNKQALVVALEDGKKSGIDAILLLGDFMDCYAESFWETDPRKRDMQYELDVYFQVIESIRKEYKNIPIYYLIGNHEERHERYLRIKAPELAHLDYLSFEHFFKTNDYGITIIKDKRIVKIGSLNCIHGHEFGRSMFSPVNPARGLYLRGKANALAGHHHQTSNHTETAMTGVTTSCWSIGCLCDMHPAYRPINNWNHGYAIVHRLDERNFYVENKKIIDGKIY